MDDRCADGWGEILITKKDKAKEKESKKKFESLNYDSIKIVNEAYQERKIYRTSIISCI